MKMFKLLSVDDNDGRSHEPTWQLLMKIRGLQGIPTAPISSECPPVGMERHPLALHGTFAWEGLEHKPGAHPPLLKEAPIALSSGWGWT
ncbi:hypothetical protein SLEP1_g18381 [Rubroshorea leprosula]|uniref:Uncharacterized protein n=1 Tax=Rubroshorea leprosula TaxID=152421 RepID=A0AAV5IX85_9ROSI|nr:hypothetical protein SLEP1_g18381 [Rubroshorea leprosula]